MKKYLCLLALLFTANFFACSVIAQSTTIKGHIKNSNSNEAVAAVSVLIKNTPEGTYTDDKGAFSITTEQKLPITLVISSIGFEGKELVVSSASQVISVDFKPSVALGQEVVVSASRTPERILESPVTIERISSANIRNTPATSYYDIVKSLKGVDVTSSSLTFTSVTTRGFNGSGNARFNQLVDGMDNQAPGLNFSVGAVVGLTELDVDNVELLPGASSALYGSGGMNGTMIISSKNPFKYQGLSFQVKQGMMHTGSNDPIGVSPFYDWSLRWGKKVSDKFAFKFGMQLIQAKDWVATDSSNYTQTSGTGDANKVLLGTRASDPNYNGVNTYGDETSADLYPSVPVPYRPLLGGATSLNVSRTGYKENEFINNNTVDFKLSGGLYYKLSPKTEMSLIGNFGTGNTVYTGSDRYSLKNLKIGQYKFEIKNDNWFVKAYTTQENSGDAFNATITARLFNEVWSPSKTSWYPTYLNTLLGSLAGGATFANASLNARAAADQNRPVAGSDQFKTIQNQVTSIPIPRGGGFLDRTNLYHFEGQYNLSSMVKFAEVLVGASYRLYTLNSKGTLFADSTGPIGTKEYGGYIQISKKFINDKLKLTASGRYDKNENFDGKFTPRFSAVLTVAPNQNIRASYQNAYRFPSNQNQWINLNSGQGILIGGLPQLRSFYHFDTQPVYTIASLTAYQSTGNPALLVQQTFGTFKPETVNSYELGYKGLFGKRVLVDVYGYYSNYKDFIGRVSAYQIATDRGFSVSVNSANKVNTYGYGIGLNYLLTNNFSIDANVSSDMIDNPDPTFATYWNTPKFRGNIGLSNTGFGYNKLFGFNVQYRWQDKFYTQADFKQGDVSAYGTVDAQISYKLTEARSLIKLGATNLTNHYYKSLFGNPSIGGLYYISFGYNVF